MKSVNKIMLVLAVAVAAGAFIFIQSRKPLIEDDNSLLPTFKAPKTAATGNPDDIYQDAVVDALAEGVIVEESSSDADVVYSGDDVVLNPVNSTNYVQ